MLEVLATIRAAAETCVRISEGTDLLEAGETPCEHCKGEQWTKAGFSPRAWEIDQSFSDNVLGWVAHTCTQFVQAQIGLRKGFILITRSVLPSHKGSAKIGELHHLNLPFCIATGSVSCTFIISTYYSM